MNYSRTVEFAGRAGHPLSMPYGAYRCVCLPEAEIRNAGESVAGDQALGLGRASSGLEAQISVQLNVGAEAPTPGAVTV